MANIAATASVRTIRRDIPFNWEGMDKRGKAGSDTLAAFRAGIAAVK